MTREQSPRRGLVATNRSGEVSDQPVFSRTGEIGNDQQVLEQHVREVVEELNGLHPVTKLRLMPYDGRVDTACPLRLLYCATCILFIYQAPIAARCKRILV